MTGKFILKYGSLDPDDVGYVYKVRADYLDRVEFSEEAEKIRRHLFNI